LNGKLWYNVAVPRLAIRQLPLILAYGSLATLALALPRWIIGWRYSQSIFQPQAAPSKPLAIVFGAGLTRDGRPTTILADRVRTAVALYQQGKIQRILMSGSTHPGGYDEPEAMRALAVSLGVPDEALILDTGGNRTYATCLRARDLFGIASALLVSQRFHLPRALATCEGLGLHAVGVAADLRPYRTRAMSFWRLREVAATWVALWETYIIKPTSPLTLAKDGSKPLLGASHGT